MNNFQKPILRDRYLSKLCDIHADYTDLKQCLLRDYIPNGPLDFSSVAHVITLLRDPIYRYISEFEHVQKYGLVWSKANRLACRGIYSIYTINRDKCYNGLLTQNITWYDFLNCDFNLAHNRQTRMLADFSQIGCNTLKCMVMNNECSDELEKFNEQKILHSAKHSLLGLAFFGLAEHQKLSEYLFLKTFGEEKFRFSESIIDIKNTNAEKAIKGEAGKYIERIKSRNHLDIELYEFAKEIFFKRVAYFQSKTT